MAISRHLLLSCTVLLTSLLAACEECPTFDACEGSDRDGSGIVDDTDVEGDTEEDGESLYADNCASCHGTDGDSGYAADLSVEVPELSDADLEDTITNGVGSSMPGFSFTSEELSALVGYVQDSWGS